MMNNKSLHRNETESDEDELLRYEVAVRKALEERSTNLICNRSLDHAAIILKLMCSTARESICIFCGQMRSAVYGNLLGYIEDAVDRGVRVRIVTEQDQAGVQTKELARHDRKWEWRSLGKKVGIPHLVLVDDDKFRLELNAYQGEAIVCTGIGEDEGRRQMIKTFKDGFEQIWAAARSH